MDNQKEDSDLMKKAKAIRWRSPIVVMTLATAVTGLYAGGHFMKIGIFLGCAMALAVLILLKKSPYMVRDWAGGHPFAADLVFSALATMMVSGFFGTGLALGIGAVTCGLFLSWGIPSVTRVSTVGS